MPVIFCVNFEGVVTRSVHSITHNYADILLPVFSEMELVRWYLISAQIGSQLRDLR